MIDIVGWLIIGAWLIIGGLVGWIARSLMRTDAWQGVLPNVIVVVVGAALAGWLISPLVGVGTIDQPRSGSCAGVICR